MCDVDTCLIIRRDQPTMIKTDNYDSINVGDDGFLIPLRTNVEYFDAPEENCRILLP